MTSKFTKHVVCGESSVTLSYETSTEDFDQALEEWIKFKKAESYDHNKPKISHHVDEFPVDTSIIEAGLAAAHKKMGEFMRQANGPVARKSLCSFGCCFECESCAAKPGTPELCQDCLQRRAACAEKHKLNQYFIACFKCGTMVEVESHNPPPEWIGALCFKCQTPNCDTPMMVDRQE